MKEDISKMGQLQVDSVLLHTKNKRENITGIRNMTKVINKLGNVRGTSCVLFLFNLHLVMSIEIDGQSCSLVNNCYACPQPE